MADDLKIEVGADTGDAERKMKKTLTGIEKGTKRVEQATRKVRAQTKAATASAGKWKSALGGAGKAIMALGAAYGIRSLVRGFDKLNERSLSIEETWKRTRFLFGANVKEAMKFKKTMMDIAAKRGIMPQEMMRAAYPIVSGTGGWDKQNVMTLADQTALIKQTMGFDPAITSIGIIKTFNIFGGDIKKITSKLNAAVDKGMLSWENMGEEWATVAAQAKSSGVKLETALSMYAEATKQLKNPRIAAQTVKMLFLRLTSAKSIKAVNGEKYGLKKGQSIFEAIAAFRKMPEEIQELLVGSEIIGSAKLLLSNDKLMETIKTLTGVMEDVKKDELENRRRAQRLDPEFRFEQEVKRARAEMEVAALKKMKDNPEAMSMYIRKMALGGMPEALSSMITSGDLDLVSENAKITARAAERMKTGSLGVDITGKHTQEAMAFSGQRVNVERALETYNQVPAIHRIGEHGQDALSQLAKAYHGYQTMPAGEESGLRGMPDYKLNIDKNTLKEILAELKKSNLKLNPLKKLDKGDGQTSKLGVN